MVFVIHLCKKIVCFVSVKQEVKDIAGEGGGLCMLLYYEIRTEKRLHHKRDHKL